MPHLITHRPRVFDPRTSAEQSNTHRIWETCNAFSYKMGGLAFVVGSVFFLPQLSAYLVYGDWLFFIGSLLYLIVTAHDLFEVLRFWQHRSTETLAQAIELSASIAYVSGSVLFLAGSLCFLPSLALEHVGAYCFIVGSLVFVFGGVINAFQVVEAPSLLYLQLFNLTIIQFVAGSALFAAASVPYLWSLSPQADTLIKTFAAILFVIASALFFFGGIAIYYRKLKQEKLETFCRVSGLGTMFIKALNEESREHAALESAGKNPAHR